MCHCSKFKELLHFHDFVCFQIVKITKFIAANFKRNFLVSAVN
jgi:hypothetical protein